MSKPSLPSIAILLIAFSFTLPIASHASEVIGVLSSSGAVTSSQTHITNGTLSGSVGSDTTGSTVSGTLGGNTTVQGTVTGGGGGSSGGGSSSGSLSGSVVGGIVGSTSGGGSQSSGALAVNYNVDTNSQTNGSIDSDSFPSSSSLSFDNEQTVEENGQSSTTPIEVSAVTPETNAGILAAIGSALDFGTFGGSLFFLILFIILLLLILYLYKKWDERRQNRKI